VDSHRLHGLEEFQDKPVLHQRLSATNGKPIRHRLQPKTIFANFFSRSFKCQEHAILHAPGVRIVTVETVKRQPAVYATIRTPRPSTGPAEHLHGANQGCFLRSEKILAGDTNRANERKWAPSILESAYAAAVKLPIPNSKAPASLQKGSCMEIVRVRCGLC
jgi:hypothetical protein